MSADRFVVEPLLDDEDELGWLGVKWRVRCPDCGWTAEPQLHPLEAGFASAEHEFCPAA